MTDTKTISLTLPNEGSPETVVYTAFRPSADRMEYRNLDATEGLRDQLVLYRTEAKRNGDSRGNKKVAMKVTIDQPVPGFVGGDIVLPEIVEVSFSVPLGCSENTTKRITEIVVAFLESEHAPALINDLVI